MGVLVDEKGDVRTIRIGVILLLILVVLSVTLSSLVVIDSGDRGVLLTFGQVQDTILQPGLNFIAPFQQSVIHMEVRTQKKAVVATAGSSDLQNVVTEVTLNYHPDPAKINTIYTLLGTDYDSKVIDPILLDATKTSTVKFKAEELVSSRDQVRQFVREDVSRRLAVHNIIVDDVSLTDFKFSDKYQQAIDEKTTAEQNALAEKNKLEIERYKAQQKVVMAQGEADATIAKAKAEAEAIKITATALKENPQLIQLEQVKKWDGRMPVFVSGGSSVPLLDISKLVTQPGI